MKKYLKYPLYIVMALLVVLVIFLGYITFALPNVGEAPEMNVEITPDKVERGKYLAYHVMMCADCHSVRDFSLFSGTPKAGSEFAGGVVFDRYMSFTCFFVYPLV